MGSGDVSYIIGLSSIRLGNHDGLTRVLINVLYVFSLGSSDLWGISGLMKTCKKMGSDDGGLVASPMIKSAKGGEKRKIGVNLIGVAYPSLRDYIPTEQSQFAA